MSCGGAGGGVGFNHVWTDEVAIRQRYLLLLIESCSQQLI